MYKILVLIKEQITNRVKILYKGNLNWIILCFWDIKYINIYIHIAILIYCVIHYKLATSKR